MSDDVSDEKEKDPAKRDRGVLAWMAKNSVAANILMIFLLIGGYLKIDSIKQEVFPEFELDLIIINVPYPGASPEEVEKGVLLVTEEAVRGLDGVKEVRATATEGTGVLLVELILGTDADQALNDVKAAIDRITSFPENVERPSVFKATNRVQVISLVLYGDDAREKTLKALAERARDELLLDDRITYVEVSGVRPLEVSIEIPQAQLRRYGLTLDQVAQTIAASCVEIPAGGIKTGGGEVLVRTAERCDDGLDFEDVTLVSLPNGSRVRVRDIGEVHDGFADTDQEAQYFGQRAVKVDVFRVGDETPIEVAAAVKEYAETFEETLPPGVSVATWMDWSEFYEQRIDLLLRNAYIGLALVLLVLGLFLEVRLAFWVTLGIPISFIGSLVFLPSTDVSINMISLFAFIIVLGMVVDDAIIVGEAIYSRRQEGMSRMRAAVVGVKEVATPVLFAIITTMIAYAPMLFVPGPAGKFFRVIPIVVMIVLFMSLIESLLILPAHLAHSKKSAWRPLRWINRQQQRFGRALERFIEKVYTPVVTHAAHRRYLAMACGFAILLGTCGLPAGGRLKFTFLPQVEGDIIFAEAELPYGTSIEETRELEQLMLDAAYEILDAHGGTENVARGIYSQVGQAGSASAGDPGQIGGQYSGSHLAEVSLYLVPIDERGISASEFTKLWRAKIETFPGLQTLRFSFETGPQAGAPIHIELNHPNMDVLELAATQLAERLTAWDGVYDIDDGFAEGKPQLDMTLTASGRMMGLTELALAQQIRASFFGAEAVRQQRGRDEIRAYVRLPDEERRSEYDIEELILRGPNGEITLRDAADVERDRSYTAINRVNGRRAITVTAQVDDATANASEIMDDVVADVLPELVETFPGLSYQVGGEQQQMDEVNEALFIGFIIAVLAIFALLAVAFKSYVQPIIILLAIPFGAVGAIMGHMIMGFDLSLMSMMGIVALSGVVVNDSLILIVQINRMREKGMDLMEAVVAGGATRFRPILLTSLTTFFGLAPMILETSVQARFLIPMAVSLGFGVIFATFITLLLVPAAYMIVEDAKHGARWLFGKE